MARSTKIDDDLHALAARIVEQFPQASRPSKQQVINETLRAALKRRLRKLHGKRNETGAGAPAESL